VATLTAQTIAAAGTDLTFSAAAGGGDDCVHSSTIALIVQNDDASSKTVTVASEYTAVLGSTSADNAYVVGANAIAIVPLSNTVYKDGSGNCAWTYSATTSVTVAVVNRW